MIAHIYVYNLENSEDKGLKEPYQNQIVQSNIILMDG